MPDLNNTAATFKSLADEGSKLKDQLDRFPKEAPLGDGERKQLEALAALAEEGLSQLREAADAKRNELIAQLSADASALETSLGAPLPPEARDQIRSRLRTILAERAQLELVAAGDFSRVVPPDFVQTLVAHLASARSEAATKQRAAAVIPVLLNAVQVAVKIGTAIAAVAG